MMPRPGFWRRNASKKSNANGKRTARSQSAIVILAAIAIVASELLGTQWHSAVLSTACLVAFAYFVLRGSEVGFWPRMALWSMAGVILYLGGYFVTARELPYDTEPFAGLALNAIRRLDTDQFPLQAVTALPILPSATQPDARPHSKLIPAAPEADGRAVNWASLSPLLVTDSEIRERLLTLKFRQEKDLSEELARLNSLSVADTGMRRGGLDNRILDDLFQEHAISKAKYRTYQETWKLLDADERRFKEQQTEELFHTLVDLLEDEKINESDKVTLINFVAQHYGKDTRLVTPLIRLYDRLDTDYPRQKRLNREFNELYIAKREALLRGLAGIGPAARQPLLDYRRKSVSRVSHSQARLDAFLMQAYGVNTRTLYETAVPRSIPMFLNREKYPLFSRFRGASYSQEYVRSNLLQMQDADRLPGPNEPVGVIDQGKSSSIATALTEGYSEAIDRLIIDPDPKVRANVAWQLAHLKRPTMIPIALDLMKDPDPDVRRMAAIGLGNYRLVDAQGANDPLFVEVVNALQNYRSNADSYGRGWALMSLVNAVDRQKTLYLIDLLLNDGQSSNSELGHSAPGWRSDEERSAVESLIAVLQHTPENAYVKTQALYALVALDAPESLGMLLHYLHSTYAHEHLQPSLWRSLVPHLTLPQEAENIEDVILHLAGRHGAQSSGYTDERLEALRIGLQRTYLQRETGEYFQLLRFLREFDEPAYRQYVIKNEEHLRLMRVNEYLRSTTKPWLVAWPLLLVLLELLRVVWLRARTGAWPETTNVGNGRAANPAADRRPRSNLPPAAAILPISVSRRTAVR